MTILKLDLGGKKEGGEDKGGRNKEAKKKF